MMKQLPKLLAAAALGSGLLGGSVQAHTIHLGTINDNLPYSIYDVNTRGTFTDKVTFRLNELSDLSGAFLQSSAAAVTVSMDSVIETISDKRLSPWLTGGSYTFADLAPGITHTLTITGTGPAFYRNVLNVAAVPEAETWLMLVIGLGLVVFQLRRTQRSLQHRPLAG